MNAPTAEPSEHVEVAPPVEKSVPWGITIAVFFVFVLYFATQFIAAITLSLHPDAQNWLTNSVIGQFSFVVLAESLTIGGLLLFLRYYKFNVRGLGLVKPKWRDLGYGLLIYPLYFLCFALIAVAASHYLPSLNVDQKQEIGFDHVQGTVALTLTFVSLVILPPITEELLVRGFLFASLRKYKPLKFIGAAILTSLVFASAHLPEGGAAGPLYIAAIDTFILSMFLCWLREKTGSLWAGILVHALKNGVAFASLFIFASR